MIEYEYWVQEGKMPTYQLVTDADPDEVEAVLHVGDADVDLIEFADNAGSRFGHRVAARVPTPLPENCKVVLERRKVLLDGVPTVVEVEKLERGDDPATITWHVDGEHVATYTLHVFAARFHRGVGLQLNVEPKGA